MKKLLPYILILIALVGAFSVATQVNAQSALGTCRFYSTGTTIDFERTTYATCSAKTTYVGWKESTLEEYQAEVAAAQNTTKKELGTCVQTLEEGVQGPAQTINNISQADCQAKGTNWKWTSVKIYNLLAPLPCPEKTPGCENGKISAFDPTQTNNFGVYINIMIKLFIGICAVLAVIMIVMGGIEYMTSELISNKEEGKKKILNAIFGLLLALGAYTLLFTINPDLLNTGLSSLKPLTLEVNLQDDVPQTADPTTGKYKNSDYKPGDPWGDNIGLVQTIPGVTKSYSECTTVGQGSGCLSTRNLNLNNINNVKAACPNALPLQLNGGTEFWHHGGTSGNTTHGPGSATIDLQSTPALDACLSGGQPLKPFTRYPAGGLYYYEGNHWHIGG